MTNPGTIKSADSFQERRGNAPEGVEDDRLIHYTKIPETQEELFALRPPKNSRLKVTQMSEAFDISDTGF